MLRRWKARYPGTPAGVRTLRREISAVADGCGMDADGIADVRVAVTEAATNAVVHGYDAADGGLCVSAYVEDDELVITVSDTGGGIVAGRESPGAGLGLPLIATLTSRFTIRTRRSGTEVRMAFPCPGSA
jgi:anti-sigma regulatory factor (Ser/Thr protein kinase)